jgi:hypothetical protein
MPTLTDRDFCRDELGHGLFAVDRDGKAHAFEDGVAKALRQQLLLYLDDKGVWRLRTHGFPDMMKGKLKSVGVCDFCGERPVTWDIPCETFAMPKMEYGGVSAPPGMSESNWAACQTCGDHVVNNRRAALLRHCQDYHDDPKQPDGVRRLLKKFQAALQQRFWEYYKGGAQPATTTPARSPSKASPMTADLCTTAREMQSVALRTAQQIRTHLQDANRRIDDELSAYLPGADCFAWTAITAQAVWAIGSQVPDDTAVTEDLLPEGSFRSFWWFEWPLPVSDPHILTDLNIDREHAHALFLASAPDGMGVYQLRLVQPYGLLAPTRFVIPWNTTIAWLRNRTLTPWQQQQGLIPVGEHGITILRFIIAACVWLRSTVVSTTEHQLERHLRKRIMRAEHLDFAPTVTVVELRRTESGVSRTGEHSHPVNWNWQWMVRGHVRNQPTKRGIRPVWIKPYTKGPADKPLKLPAEKVFLVDR